MNAYSDIDSILYLSKICVPHASLITLYCKKATTRSASLEKIPYRHIYDIQS